MDPTRWQELVDQLRGSNMSFWRWRLARRSTAWTSMLASRMTRSLPWNSMLASRMPRSLQWSASSPSGSLPTCAFLQTALPRGPKFPDWRSGDEATIREWLNVPREGVLFDIEHNDFWLDEWGCQPDSLEEALCTGSNLIAAAPKLIPIYSHRMMPDEPHLPGNPVFSVHQTDIIRYGFNLADYLRHEFRLSGREPWPDELRSIRFWDVDRFLDVRWAGGSCIFDNRRGLLPEPG